MTEKEIYYLQRDIYWYLSNRFQQENIPPIIQKLIIEGIYCKIQMLAESYDWNLFIEKRVKEKGLKNKQETEILVPDYMKDEEQQPIPDYIRDSKGTVKETPEGVTYG